MIEKNELSAILRAVSVVVRDYVGDAKRVLTERIDRTDSEIRSIPAGPKGESGRDADTELLRTAIAAEVARQVSEMPRPKDGESAPPIDMVAVRSMIDDSVLIAVEALPKAKDGRDGTDGAAGEAGPVGPIGQSGIDGVNGKDGKDGKDGVDGLSIKGDAGGRGESGAPGINGKDGAAGRDALQIEILSTIDEVRSYPRGTFARYRNGLIRSFRDTEAITGELEKSGWEVIVSGPTFEIVQKENLRSFDVIATDTNGKQVIRTFTMPVVIDQGVFKDGVEYVRGDATTWDGSSWTCQVESTKAKPGTSPDWRLAVKRGSAGKDLRPPDNKPNPGPVKL